MEFFNQAITVLQTLVIALGAGLGVWGVINLLEGYGNDNPGAKSQGMKQLMAGAGVAIVGMVLVPLLSHRMDFLLDALTNWLKEMLVGGIMGNLSGMFDSVNQQVADIATQVGQTPQGWNGSIFSMIQNLSNSIMVPIAGVILAIVMTLELIQMITDRNNLWTPG